MVTARLERALRLVNLHVRLVFKYMMWHWNRCKLQLLFGMVDISVASCHTLLSGMRLNRETFHDNDRSPFFAVIIDPLIWTTSCGSVHGVAFLSYG